MPIDVTCPSCDAILPVPEEYAGKQIRCADCEAVITVPASALPDTSNETYGIIGDRPKRAKPVAKRATRDANAPAEPPKRKPRAEWDDDENEVNNPNTRQGRQTPKGLSAGVLVWGFLTIGCVAAGVGALAFAVLPLQAKPLVAPPAVAANQVPQLPQANPQFGGIPGMQFPNIVNPQAQPPIQPINPNRFRGNPPIASNRAMPGMPDQNPVIAEPHPNANRAGIKGLIKEHFDGLTISASSQFTDYSPANLIDGVPTSTWYSAPGDSASSGKTPWIQLDFPEEVSVKHVKVFGTRDPNWLDGYSPTQGKLVFMNEATKILAEVTLDAAGARKDFEYTFNGGIEGVRSVRFTVTQDAARSGYVALSEIEIE